jgi:acyl-CoA reductase-like NAD-dependent aldehyde dehydrogenase
MKPTPIWIAGKQTIASGESAIESPWDGSIVGTVPKCSAREVDLACEHAKAMLQGGGFPQHERAAVLEEAARLLRGRIEDFARRITLEGGKPIRAARTEATRCVDTLTFAAVEARRLAGEVLPMEASASGAGKLALAIRVPIGVVAAISPFNFPLNLVAHKVAPAIAAGCPVVLKPASQTPLSAIAFVDLLVEAGLPTGWVSVVTGSGKDVGGPLVEHAIPALVSFTGSPDVGWGIAERAPRKRVSLELGSTSPLIVEPDADLDRLAPKLGPAAFGSAGQSCISVQRVLAHETIHRRVCELLVEAARTATLGDPMEEATDVGPLISQADNARVSRWIAEATEGGAKVLIGDEVRDRVFAPTVVDAVARNAKLWTSEVFAPVVVVQKYRDFDEAIALANDSAYGLHAGVFTPRLDRALQAARELEFGGVLINEVPTFRADQQPYGGVRDAGNTREGPAYAVHEMTVLRFVSFEG